MSISNAIRALTNSEKWYVVDDEDITTRVWEDTEEESPTDLAIEAEVIVQQKTRAIEECKNNRVNGKYELIIEDVNEGPIGKKLVSEGYPSIGDQLDMIFHAGLGGDEFQSTIQAVKDANPKPI
jgi:hypothetical protein